MRIALYHRVSTLDQDPTLARGELLRAARALGGRVVLNVEETGSGARQDRPGMRKVLEAARKRSIDAVLVWKLDRFGRSMLDLLAQVRELETCGVRFIATSQGLDVRPGSDATSTLILNVLASVSQFEREMIRDRTRLGMQRARAKGRTLGRPRVELPSVDEVRRRRAEGQTVEAIAAALGVTVWACRKALVRAETYEERFSAETAQVERKGRPGDPKKQPPTGAPRVVPLRA